LREKEKLLCSGQWLAQSKDLEFWKELGLVKTFDDAILDDPIILADGRLYSKSDCLKANAMTPAAALLKISDDGTARRPNNSTQDPALRVVQQQYQVQLDTGKDHSLCAEMEQKKVLALPLDTYLLGIAGISRWHETFAKATNLKKTLAERFGLF
jgi:hypothetical protein